MPDAAAARARRDGVEGIETTLPLFRALVREPAIIDGDYHIHWLEQYLAGQQNS
jgi:acetyl-CoA carboxylase, biotin carboxylase subunit